MVHEEGAFVAGFRRRSESRGSVINGKSLGTVWKKPYRVDVSSNLKPGENVVKISAVNAWVNRMIGDRQPDVAKKYTFTNPEFYKADSPLLPSGLLGPVQIVRAVNAD